MLFKVCFGEGTSVWMWKLGASPPTPTATCPPYGRMAGGLGKRSKNLQAATQHTAAQGTWVAVRVRVRGNPYCTASPHPPFRVSSVWVWQMRCWAHSCSQQAEESVSQQSAVTSNSKHAHPLQSAAVPNVARPGYPAKGTHTQGVDHSLVDAFLKAVGQFTS